MEKPSIKKILGGSSDIEHRYIPNFRKLKTAVKLLKDAGYRVVLTQGVYDLLHEGHARYLEKARKKGEIYMKDLKQKLIMINFHHNYFFSLLFILVT